MLMEGGRGPPGRSGEEARQRGKAEPGEILRHEPRRIEVDPVLGAGGDVGKGPLGVRNGAVHDEDETQNRNGAARRASPSRENEDLVPHGSEGAT